MATKKKGNKKILPYILLPLSMFIAGVIKVTISVIPDLVTLIGYGTLKSYTDVWDSVCDTVSVIVFVVVIVLASLCCKGLTKKLHFIASACAGSLVYIFTNNIKNIVYNVFNEIDYDLAVILPYVFSALIVPVCFILAVLVAELFFKKLSSYEEAPEIEGKKSFDIKKMIIPAVLIMGVAVLQQGCIIFNDFVIDRAIEEYWKMTIVDGVWNFGVNLLLIGILVGSVFIVKDKYKALTCLASACVGYSFVLRDIYAIAYSILYDMGFSFGILDLVWYGLAIIVAIIGAIIGIAFYILLNRKEMKKIED